MCTFRKWKSATFSNSSTWIKNNRHSYRYGILDDQLRSVACNQTVCLNRSLNIASKSFRANLYVLRTWTSFLFPFLFRLFFLLCLLVCFLLLLRLFHGFCGLTFSISMSVAANNESVYSIRWQISSTLQCLLQCYIHSHRHYSHYHSISQSISPFVSMCVFCCFASFSFSFHSNWVFSLSRSDC